MYHGPMANPYTPPGSPGGYPPPPYYPPYPVAPPSVRSTGLTVLAYFAVILGAFGLIGTPMTLVLRFLVRDPVSRRIQDATWTGAYGAWTYFSVAIGFTLAVLLLITGIGIFKMRLWARTTGLIYGVVSVATVVIGQIMTFAVLRPMMMQILEQYPNNHIARAGATGGLIGGIAGSLFGLALPVVMLVAMSRPETKARFEAANPRG